MTDQRSTAPRGVGSGARRLFVTASPRRTTPGTTTLALRPRRRSLLPASVLTQSERVETEPLRELGAAGVRLVGDLDRCRAEHEPGAGREVVLRQVEVDVQLIAGERPPVGILGDEGDDPGVHHVELHVGMGRSVDGALAAPDVPRIADHATGRGRARPRRGSLARRGWPAHDQIDGAGIGGRLADVVERRHRARRS